MTKWSHEAKTTRSNMGISMTKSHTEVYTFRCLDDWPHEKNYTFIGLHELAVSALSNLKFE
jgi:hypothetical protein